MKRQLNFTSEQQDEFIEKCDPGLIITIHENNMLDEDIPFNDFFRSYQKLHLRKYGKTLAIPDKK